MNSEVNSRKEIENPEKQSQSTKVILAVIKERERLLETGGQRAEIISSDQVRKDPFPVKLKFNNWYRLALHCYETNKTLGQGINDALNVYLFPKKPK